MNGNALKVRRVLEKHKIIGLDTAPFIYYIEEIEPYADLLVPVYSLLEKNTLRAVTSTVTVAEILTKPFADKNFTLADEIKFTLRSFSSLSVVSIDDKVAERPRSFGRAIRSASPMPCKSPWLYREKPHFF